MVHRHRDRARLQYAGALRCHLEHLFIGDSTQLLRLGNDARIGRINPVDIGEDIAAVGLQRGGERDGRGVRPAAAERRDAVARPDALKPGDDGDLALGEAPLQFGRVDPLDARLAVHLVGADRDLPAEPGAGVDAERLQ